MPNGFCTTVFFDFSCGEAAHADSLDDNVDGLMSNVDGLDEVSSYSTCQSPQSAGTFTTKETVSTSTVPSFHSQLGHT